MKNRQPGKPARLAGSGRKLVSAFRPTSDSSPVEDNEFTRAAKEISYGLAVFRFIFGSEDETQESPFHGFSPHEIRWATDKSSIRRRQVENEHRARGVLLSPFMLGSQRNTLFPSSSTGVPQRHPNDIQNKQVVKSEEKKSPHLLKSSLNENSLRKKALKHHLQRTVKDTEKSYGPSSANSNHTRGIVRKFVLPVRSAHSSRVIKPNKRFRDIDGEAESFDSSEGIRVKKIRVNADTDEDSSSSWIGKRTGESSDGESMSGWSSSVSTTGSSVKDEDFQPHARGKVILRKAKLKVHEPDPPAIQGPFSSGALVPQKVTCGVCGAVRYYRYLKQARKFGIYSCESCRKFISRILHAFWAIQQQGIETHTLPCKSGTGNCFVPQYCKTGDNRCKACWLKMCLGCYDMPQDLTCALNQWLPHFMRDSSFETIPKNRRQRNRHQLPQNSKQRVSRKCTGKQSIANHITKRAAEAIARKELKIKSEKKSELKTSIVANKLLGKRKLGVKDKIVGRPSLKLKRLRKEKGDKEDKLARIQRKREEKLVRLHKLKGPRVKHVCRSASLVLGQPVATFTDTSPSKQKQSYSGKTAEDLTTSDLSRSNRSLDETSNTSGKFSESSSRIRQSCNENEGSKNKSTTSKNSGNIDSTEEGLLEGKARTLQDLSRQHYELINGETIGDELGLVSIHFWESYDPEEVGKNGFSLIGIGETSLPNAICFICGSAGLDKLIHCACCCEAYHRYCVEAGGSGGEEGGDWWAVDWVCARCTLCSGCGRGGGAQVACQKCHKSYHTECLAADRVASRLHSADRPWVCMSCLCCKSCNQAEVYKFVGNLPLCRQCFKLRQKGNFCPLCQRCYDENDFDTKVKMMECERCKCWVHAKCEGLSNEKYHILSILPESVEFVCRLCCKMPPAPWWLAVETEMKAGFLAVLKSLSKNRKACDLLKCSPTKMSHPVCTCGSVVRQRVPMFPDISEQSDVDSSDVKLPSENQKEVTGKCEEECLKSLPNFSTGNSESLVCDPKIENSNKHLSLCDVRTDSAQESSVLLKSEELQLKLDSDAISYQNADEKPAQFSPHATSQSDSGIGSTDDELKSTNDQCVCLELESWNKTPPSLLTIKKKVNSSVYDSLDCFNKEMEEMLSRLDNQELLKIYHQTLEDIFPWFNPKGSEVLDATTRISHQSDTAKTIESVSDKNPEESDVEDVSITLKGKLDLSTDYYYNIQKPADNRICLLCKQVGEGKPFEEGRLLYCGQNDWVHTNCALWSNEVFEEIDGSLQNVQSAISRSRHIRCSYCSKKGASVGCCNRTCPEAYHFNCAKESGCVFNEDKSLFCANHKDDCVSSRPLVTGPDFLVSRPVYVELERKRKKCVPRHEVKVMIGSLTISSLGDFDPDLSDQELSIIPCNFQCSRWFWSSFEPWRLVQYSIKTKIVYTVCESSMDDDNYTIDHSLGDDSCLVEENEKKPHFFEVDENVVKETLDLILDNVCAKEEEDPQASTDLLPPELKEAIFEDLPHDLLDGISMQDIFPKLMSFDSSSLDFKAEKECKPCVKTNITKKNIDKKHLNNDHFTNIFDSKVTLKRLDMKEKSETQSNQVSKRKLRSHNSDIKKFDKSEGKENSKKWSLSKILQIDGAADDISDLDSSASEDSNSLPPLLTTSPLISEGCQSPYTKTSLAIYRDNHQPYSNRSSECSSPEIDDIFLNIEQLDGATDFCSGKDNKPLDEDPVKCTRCHRTYRTALSLERHLQTCNVDFLSCSESDSSEEEKASSPEIKIQKVGDSNTLLVKSESKDIATPSKNTHHNMSSKYTDKSVPTVKSNESSSLNNKVLLNKSSTNITQSSSQTSMIDYSTLPHCTVVVNKLENHQTYPAKQKIIRPNFECEDSSTPVTPACGRSSPVRIRAVRRPIKTYSRKKQICTSSSTTNALAVNMEQQKQMEYHVPNASPALLIQQMPTHNMVPSYIESIQTQPNVQPNGVHYQYITAIDVQEKPQQIPVAVQIQPQISLQPMMGPTVLGTLIQPNGVEQLVVNAPTPSVDVMNQQPTNVYIANMNPQTMLMGVETVISNTVMSTSQFVSGMITGSSYSATTTQVFQTAKPLIDVPQSYVVVNTPSNPVTHTVPQTVYPPPTSQPWTYNYQETYKVKERTTYQQITRPVTQEAVSCMKMVNQEAIFVNKPVVQEVTVEKTHSIQKTVPVPGLLDSLNDFSSPSINGHLDKTQYSQGKVVFNNTVPLSSWEEPKIKEIIDVDIGKSNKPAHNSANSPAKTQPETTIYYPSKIINASKPEINVTKIDQNNLENKVEISNMSKPIVNMSNVDNVKNPSIKPVISKVKAKSNEKSNRCSVLCIKTPTVKSNSPNKKEKSPILVPKVEPVQEREQEQGNSPLSKTENCLNNNQSKKDERIKVEPQKKIEYKRLPLKENKVVGNKSKTCKDIKKSSSAPNMSHPKLMYEITSQDGRLSICSQDVVEAWQKIFDAVQAARAEKRLPPLPQNPQKSHLSLLGLDNNSVKYLLEQLPGVKSCKNYKPVYHKTKLFGHSEQLRENPTGCARSEPISNKKRKYDMFSWLASRHRQPPKLIVNSETEIINGISRRATNTSLPMAMRFRHLKETSKEAVGVFRSDIHGRGLFCLRDIDGGEMVIEYAGEVIRAGLTDKREHYYTAKGIGCYMFRIDDQFVVDATMHGNAARFINHSCEPNCFSKVVDILGKKHILIFALRKITQGEELTYDYKFPLEDEKISCHCLSRKCRKYLN